MPRNRSTSSRNTFYGWGRGSIINASTTRSRVAIIGLEFGSKVLLPAFRRIPDCEVVALCGTNLAKTEAFAKELGVENAFASFERMIDSVGLDAIACSAPPGPQQAIALLALRRGLGVFAEKPLGVSPSETAILAGLSHNRTTMVDFEFPEMPTWRRARELMEASRPQSLTVTWNIMTYIAEHFVESWKCDPRRGGAALHIFGSHLFYNLEWFMGQIGRLSATVSKHPNDPRDTHTAFELSAQFENGGTAKASVNTRFEGEFVHRWEWADFSLENRGRDYMKNWTLFQDNRLIFATESETVDGRIAPVSSMAARFIAALRARGEVRPSFQDGHRVQKLIGWACDSAARGGEVVECGGIE